MSVGLGWREGVGRRGKFAGVASLGMWLPVHLVSAGEVLGVLQNIVHANNYCWEPGRRWLSKYILTSNNGIRVECSTMDITDCHRLPLNGLNTSVYTGLNFQKL